MTKIQNAKNAKMSTCQSNGQNARNIKMPKM